MEIVLMGVGDTTKRFVSDGIAEYTGRLRRYVPFRTEWLRDIKQAGRIETERQKTLEGELILSKIQSSDMCIILDERGHEYTSREFAGKLEKMMSAGRKRIIFVIGGPYGFSKDVYARADLSISLSRMTFTHEMVRLFFTEQIYRAMTILHGEPYHHD